MKYGFCQKNIHQGFTLIETLFAILIFSGALIALMTIAARGISATANAAGTTTASYLAQEGIEIARNIRDTNYANGSAWDAGLSTCTTAAPCKVLYGNGSAAPTLAACASAGSVASPACSDPVLFATAGNGYADSGTASPYVRTVYVIPAAPITDASGNQSIDEYEIVSRVNWTSKSIPHVVTLVTIVKNWQ